jgi:predicted amidohydrolase YtcJ
MGPKDKFDLVIKGGEVLDPSQKLRAKRDIGMRFGLVEAVEADIPAERALRVLDAGGKLVAPGLIDLHAHVYPYGSAIGIPADELVPYQATATVVSAGDSMKPRPPVRSELEIVGCRSRSTKLSNSSTSYWTRSVGYCPVAGSRSSGVPASSSPTSKDGVGL